MPIEPLGSVRNSMPIEPLGSLRLMPLFGSPSIAAAIELADGDIAMVDLSNHCYEIIRTIHSYNKV